MEFPRFEIALLTIPPAHEEEPDGEEDAVEGLGVL